MKKSLTLTFLIAFWSVSSFAAGIYTLNGTFGCVSSPNFSGFINRVTNGAGSSNEGNGLFLVKFTSGSPTVSFSGISNTISNFEQSNVAVKTNIFSNVNHFKYTPNSPIENMFMIEDTSTSPPFITYFIMVNSGKTFMGIDAPTVDKNSNIVCQAL